MDVHSVLDHVLSTYASFALVFVPYFFGRLANVYKKVWQNYLFVFASVAVFCFVLWHDYGTHIENSDPLEGGGERGQDFEPTEKQRNEYGLEKLLTFEIAAMYGVYRGNRNGPSKTGEDEKE
jgi:hypothetical protein